MTIFASVMDIELFREYCLSLPLVTEDMPFDETVVVFRLKGKIFACITLDKPDIVVLKCDPDRALDLKKYWNQIRLDADVDRSLIEELTRHAYNEVNAKLPKKDRVNPIEN